MNSAPGALASPQWSRSLQMENVTPFDQRNPSLGSDCSTGCIMEQWLTFLGVDL